jgi:glucose/arabinose dehydrogenase
MSPRIATALRALRGRERTRNRARLLIGFSLVLAIAGCGTGQPTPTPQPPTTNPPSSAPPGSSAEPAGSPAATTQPASLSITLEPFATVPGGPLAMTALDDGTGRLLVASQDGMIWAVEANGSVAPNPMVDISGRITSGGEQGLLGLAAHPTFPADPRVFVDYTDTNGDTIVASLSLADGDANRLDPDSHQQLLFVDQPYPNHNGGALAFGPDGYLYVSLGDGGAGGDPHDNGQRLDTLLGKILRLDIDGGETYLIPEGNPFADGGGLPEIWHYGLRNPWRLSFDRETGDLWMGDVGQGSWEEIDVARAGLGGLNFGWVVMEGSHCYRSDTCDRDGLTLPATDYGRDQGCTVIGGYVYRGQEHAFLRGTYLFADYCSGNLFAIDASATEYTTPTVVGTGSNGIAAFGEDGDGELYALALDGTISRVVATQR